MDKWLLMGLSLSKLGTTMHSIESTPRKHTELRDPQRRASSRRGPESSKRPVAPFWSSSPRLVPEHLPRCSSGSRLWAVTFQSQGQCGVQAATPSRCIYIYYIYRYTKIRYTRTDRSVESRTHLCTSFCCLLLSVCVSVQVCLCVCV